MFIKLLRAVKCVAFSAVLLCLNPCVLAKPVLNIQTWQTANHVPVYFVSAKELPMVDINVIFAAGSSRDAAQYGLAQLTNSLLEQGAANLTADQIADSFDSVGAIFNTEVNRDMAIVGLRSITDSRYLQPALRLFSQVLTEPDFPNDQFLRTQQQVVSALKQQQQSPNAIAAKALFAGLYSNHPYSHPVLGTPATVSQLTRENLQNFYHQYYVAKNALLVIVGNLDKTAAENIANQITAKLPLGTVPTPLQTPPTLSQAKQQTLSYPSEQTHIYIGQALPLSYNSPDYFALSLDNYILGGATLTSQLFKQIREQRGLAYNVASYLIPLQNSSLYLINLQTRNDKATAALSLTQQAVQNFIKQGPSEKELRAAQENAINGFPLQLASNSAITANVISIAFYHLPLNYWDTYRSKVSAVTIKQAKDILQKYFSLQNMYTVRVGNLQDAASSAGA